VTGLTLEILVFWDMGHYWNYILHSYGDRRPSMWYYIHMFRLDMMAGTCVGCVALLLCIRHCAFQKLTQHGTLRSL